jgi:hypothetical protein
MRKNVPQPGNLAPFHFRKLRFHLVGDLFRRFSEDFQVSKHGIVDKGRLHKGRQIETLRVLLYFGAARDHVL